MNLALISLFTAAILGGGASVFIKIALLEIPLFSFLFLRFFVAGILLVPLFIKRGYKIDADTGKVMLVSLLGTMNIVLFAYGIRLTSATASSIFYSAVPIVAVIISYFLLKEKITLIKLIGVFVGFIGALLLIFLPLLEKNIAFQSNLIGNILIFTAMITFTFYTVVSKKLQTKYSPLYLTTIMVITSAIIVFFFAIPEFIHNPSWMQHISLKSIIAVVYSGAAGTFIYYLLYQYAIKHGGPIIASLTFYIQPIATFIWATLLLGEKLTIEFIVSAALVLIGTLITTNTKKGR